MNDFPTHIALYLLQVLIVPFQLYFNPTLHGLQLYLLYMGGGGFRPPSKMDLSGCFWLKSTSNPKSR